MKSMAYTGILCLFAGWVLATLVGLGANETQAQKNSAPASKTELRLASWDGGYSIIRYNPSTGATARVTGEELRPYAEPAPLPKGDYEVQAIGVGKLIGVVRIEKVSGRVWLLGSNASWSEVKEVPAK